MCAKNCCHHIVRGLIIHDPIAFFRYLVEQCLDWGSPIKEFCAQSGPEIVNVTWLDRIGRVGLTQHSQDMARSSADRKTPFDSFRMCINFLTTKNRVCRDRRRSMVVTGLTDLQAP